MTLDMHALTLYRLAMKNPEARNSLLTLAAALQRGAARLRDRQPPEPFPRLDRPAGPPAARAVGP